MAAISRTFSKSFSCMKIVVLRFKFRQAYNNATQRCLWIQMCTRADLGFEIRGGANGLEILKKKDVCVCGWVGVGVCVEKRKGDILNILQIYDNHSIYISITIYLKYDFYYKTVYLKPPYTMLFKKNLIGKILRGGGGRPPPKKKKLRGGGGGGGGRGGPGAPPP